VRRDSALIKDVTLCVCIFRAVRTISLMQSQFTQCHKGEIDSFDFRFEVEVCYVTIPGRKHNRLSHGFNYYLPDRTVLTIYLSTILLLFSCNKRTSYYRFWRGVVANRDLGVPAVFTYWHHSNHLFPYCHYGKKFTRCGTSSEPGCPMCDRNDPSAQQPMGLTRQPTRLSSASCRLKTKYAT
jgi:hypothetical protein